jgi:predicted O-linked N-acetylglucosamine transferase (SPINDLY family)
VLFRSWLGLAAVAELAGRADLASDAARRAALLEPADTRPITNLSLALKQREQRGAAVTWLRRALRLVPDDGDALHALGGLFSDSGEGLRALSCFKAAVLADPGRDASHASLIFMLDFDPSVDLAEQQRECQRWARWHAQRVTRRTEFAGWDRDPERRLRVGYVSADLRHHSAAVGFSPLLLDYDRTQIDVFCYSGVRVEDAYSAQFRAAAAGWRRVVELSDSRLDALIHADRIDILVDLSGHTGGSRLRAFARKPAPIQCSIMGTGLREMDYVVGHPIRIRPEEHGLYVERIAYLDDGQGGFSSFDGYGPQQEPALAPPPACTRGFVTFGCFNRVTKMSDDALAAWARVLGAVPRSRLVLKAVALSSPDVLAATRRRLIDHGIAPARVDLLGATGGRAHLEAHALVDVMFDPFPFGGGVSTLDAVWMGVPVITLYGRKPSARVTAAIESALGLDMFVAQSVDEYVQLAIDWTRRADDLATLRPEIRRRMKNTAVGNPALYARAFERLYRRIWRDWCAAGQ